MNIKVVPFGPEHMRRFMPRPEDAADLEGIEIADLCADWHGWSTVMVDDCAPAFFFGTELEDGVGVIYAVTSPLVDNMGLFITKLARFEITSLFDQGAHRVEAYCHVGNMRSLKWLTQSLGMTVEGLMRKSGQNAQDRYLLSILPDEVKY